MKNSCYILLLLFIITGCNNTTKETIVSKNLVKEFRPIIQGVWDNQKETERIFSKDQSIRDTSAQCISTLDIETQNIVGNVLLVHVGLCNGQGTDMMLKFEPGKHTRTILLDDHYELGYRVASGITTLIVYYNFKGKTKVFEFVKMLNYFPRP